MFPQSDLRKYFADRHSLPQAAAFRVETRQRRERKRKHQAARPEVAVEKAGAALRGFTQIFHGTILHV